MVFICKNTVVVMEKRVIYFRGALKGFSRKGTLFTGIVSLYNLGDLIKGSGGLRKVRWNLKGTGKSGDVRVIYYWVVDDHHIRMLYVYPK